MDFLSNLSAITPAMYLALVILLAVGCQWLAWALHVPSLLLLLVVGFAFGQGVRANDVLGQDVVTAGVSIAVGLILFEGSLGLRFRELRNLGTSVRRLCSVTVLIAWPLIAASAFIAGVEPRLAVLIGALLVVTGPTVINPIVRQLRPTKRVSALLRWEGIIVDPIGAVLAALVFQALIAPPDSQLTSALVALGRTLVVGFGLGLGLGWVLTLLLRQRAIPDFLEGGSFLGAAVGGFVLSNLLQGESGLLTVTVFGVYLANQPGVHLERVREFKENLQVLFVGAIFILLAGQLTPGDLREVLPTAVVFIALLVLVVRPLSINLSLIGSDSTRSERTLLTFMAPRGIVAAAVTSMFALELRRSAEAAQRAADGAVGSEAAQLVQRQAELASLADAAADLVPLVFLVVVATVAIYGLGVGRVAERLGLASASPQGVLIAGSSPWVIETAERLHELDVPVRLISQDRYGVRQARMAGIPVEHSHVLSEHVSDDLDVAGLGYFIGATPDDETNATAARELGRVFGQANSYQLARVDPPVHDPARDRASDRVTGRRAFDPPLTFDQLRARTSNGMAVRRTHLTEEFTAADFRERYGENAVVLFVVEEGKVRVATTENSLPDGPAQVIALLPERDS